jgi:tagaturonate epimerase
MKIPKYTFGTGDRFGQQGKAQLEAIQMANNNGVDIYPVWNKSNREHQTIGTVPADTRKEADEAVKALNWNKPYFVDADHVNLSNIDGFIGHADFFTIDVADYIGHEAEKSDIAHFIKINQQLMGTLSLHDAVDGYEITENTLQQAATKFLYAVKQAGVIYRHIIDKKGTKEFITEISMDEVNDPQSPVELLLILKMLADENIPLQTIAPKFTGRFNKGVDYEGNIDQFAKEFEEDLLVIDYAVKHFGLQDNLKLSIHSGSDKFSIYPIMGKLIKQYDKGIHVKTAGTTWLEEITGMAVAGGDALEMAKKIYAEALKHKDELCKPYATVIDIHDANLPNESEIERWDGKTFANALRHIPGHSNYNPDFRQLIHVGYKIAANLGDQYINMLNKNEEVIANEVKTNIYERHIKRLFG